MTVYIIGTIRDTKYKTIGYTLMDIDNKNQTMQVNKNALVSALKANKLKIKNAKLHGDTVQGIYYSLNILSYHIINNGVQSYVNKGVLVLNKIGNWYTVLVTDKIVATTVIDEDKMRSLIWSKAVINIDEYGRLLYKENDNTQVTDNVPELNKKILDPNAEITQEEFEKFMWKNNWRYTIQNLDPSLYGPGLISINDIDCHCDVVHLPVNCYSVTHLFSKRPANSINVLIINEKCRGILELFQSNSSTILEINDRIKINNLVFQGRHEYKEGASIEFKGEIFSNTNINCIVDLTQFNTLSRMFNNCSINELILGEKSSVYDSFNNVHIGSNSNKELELHITRRSIRSFNKITGINTLKVFDTESIDDSCSECSASNIEFLGKKLNYMYSTSFNNCNNIKCIDMSSIRIIQQMQGFNNCENLSEFKLPTGGYSANGKRYLGVYSLSRCFNNTKIRRIVLNSCVISVEYPVLPEDGTVVFDESCTNISGKLLNKFQLNNDNKLEFLSNKLKLDTGIFDNLSIYTREPTALNMNKQNIVKFEPSCFRYSKVKEFNSLEYPNLHEIPSYTFINTSSLHTLIIGDNIKKLGESITKDCESLRVVVIGPEVKDIDPKVFTYTRQKGVICAYVVKGTPGYELVSKRKNTIGFEIIEVESVAEALRLLKDSNLTAEDKMAKFRLVLQGTKYDKLLSESYQKNIQFMYKVYSTFEGNYIPQNVRPIDTSKFINIPLSSYNNIWNKIRIYHREDVEHQELYLASISNLFTSILPIDSRLHNSILWNYINDVSVINVQSVILAGSNHFIGTLNIKISDNYSINILVIEIDNIIRFVAVYDVNSVSKRLNGDIKKMHTMQDMTSQSTVLDAKTSVSHLLNAGDVIGATAVISNIEFPRITIDNINMPIIITKFYESTLCLGINTDEYGSNGKTHILFYDILGQRLILAIISGKTYSNNTIKNTTSIIIESIVDLDNIKLINKKLFDIVSKATAIGNMTNNKLSSMVLNPQLAMIIAADEANYDTQINKELISVGVYCYKNNIKELWEMSDKAFKMLVASGIFTENKYTMASLDKSMSITIVTSHPTLGDKDRAESTWMEFSAYSTLPSGNNYIIIRKYKKHTSSSKLTGYETCLPRRKLIELLKHIGEAAINKAPILNKITNESVDKNRFIIMHSSSATDYAVGFALEVASGNPYIILEDSSYTLKTIFRFNNISEAWRIYSTYFANNNKLGNLITFDVGKKLIESLLQVRYEDSSGLEKLRQSILNGLPNNYPYVPGVYKYGKMISFSDDGTSTQSQKILTEFLDATAKQMPE